MLVNTSKEGRIWTRRMEKVKEYILIFFGGRRKGFILAQKNSTTRQATNTIYISSIKKSKYRAEWIQKRGGFDTL